MRARERISADEKYEVLSTLSPRPVMVVSGFLGGMVVALLLSPVVVPLSSGGEGMGKEAIRFLAILGILGAIAAQLLHWEYKLNRETYKRASEFHTSIVYPFFFICALVALPRPWFKLVSQTADISIWSSVLALVIVSAILGPAWEIIWRFWHVLWLSILSPLDWRAVIEERNFDRQLKLSFAEVKRYPSPLSLSVMDIDQFDHLRRRVVRRIQEELINIIDKNVRDTDVTGRIGGGRVIVSLLHTGSSGAIVQAERVKKILEEHLKSRRAMKEGMTLSIGIAPYTPDTASHKDLIEKGQRALQRAKEEGGNRIVVG